MGASELSAEMIPKMGFGLITAGKNDHWLQQVVNSIRAQNIPDYEICICGPTGIDLTGIIHTTVDEEKYPNKIGHKKNITNSLLDAEVIVHMHDYIHLEPGWWEGLVTFGFNWDLCMTCVRENDGTRNCDWMRSAFRTDSIGKDIVNCSLVPYDDYSQIDYQYIQGNYWLSKKQVIENDPIDSALSAGEMEDVKWSDIVLKKYKYVMNPYSTVRYLKSK